MTVLETAPEFFQAALVGIDLAISWVEENARVCPLIVAEGLPPALREHLREGPSYTFDSLVPAIHEQLLLISDDQPTREFGRMVGFTVSSWLHNVLSMSLCRRVINLDTRVRITAKLVNFGQNYLGVSADVLTRSAGVDAEAGRRRGISSTP